jgi:hypothetical protein
VRQARTGGLVSPSAYWVGEKGPELIAPGHTAEEWARLKQALDAGHTIEEWTDLAQEQESDGS